MPARRATRGLHALEAALDRGARDLAPWLLPFYRRFPYRGPLGLFQVDPRGAWSPADRFFFNRIPKAANSTVLRTLAQVSAYRRRPGIDPKRAFLRPSRLSSAEVARLAGDGFKFTFVRDPYARTLSAFSDKIARRRPQSRDFFAWRGGAVGAPPTFAEFLGYLDDGGLLRDPHWTPQTHLLLLPIEAFDVVGRVETLEADLGRVVGRVFGRPLDPVRHGLQTDADSRVEEAYTREAFATVNRLYAEDFERLGYPMRSG